MYLSAPAVDTATPTDPSSLSNSPASSLFGLSSIFLVVDGATQLQRWSSLIGIVTAIIGNILISFALNIQRYAHIRLHEEKAKRKERAKALSKGLQGGYGTAGTNGHRSDHDHNQEQADGDEDDPLRRSFLSSDSDTSTCSKHETTHVQTYLKSPYWWGGIILMTIGEAGNFLAYGFAPASIVSPLGVVALISNCVIAPIMLKEHFRLRDFWGVVVAVGGAVTVVLSAKTQEKKFGPHEIWGAITNLEFEIYMAITIFLIVVLMWASPKYGSKTSLIDLGLVGLFGGYTALSTKGVASMLSSTLWRAFTTPVTYALIAVLVGTAVMQVRYVNKALQRFDSTQVIPIQFVMFTLSVIIGSAILYRDFEKTTGESVAKFVGGCLLTFFGVYLITSGRPSHDDEEEVGGDADEGEERIGLLHQDPSSAEVAPTLKENNFESVRPKVQARHGDANYDFDPVTRRSSRVSFAESSSRPRTPKMFSNASYPQSSREGDQTGLENPWLGSTESLLDPKPAVTSTISTPVLPTDAQASLSDLLRPQVADRSSSHGNLHTHPNLQQSPAPPEADRPVTPAARHSIARMIPGPFISPLSGGLSVVVADTLRRGVESPRIKRPRLSIRRSKSGSQRLSHGTNVSSYYDESDTPPQTANALDHVSKSLGTEGEWTRVTRTRSLSNTLGDFLRGKRQKLDNREGDEEAGPSGS
ncbi:hypothetical protein HYFRA_00004515 [Hymenoscyphus fraxineus]|uniref:DUF803-domain-containing protein n=1 Tax=Hymenoscyphus fraxineus TaxID=746836 RepID=A0A9N9KXX5_9HELO|nr:hypothetical protein HYFRA_00004515 [Hymenoscyphus fraxineus]